MEIQDIVLYVPLSVDAANNSIAATFGPMGGPAAPLSLAQVHDANGNPIAAALMASVQPAVAAPQSFTLTVPDTNVLVALAATVNGQTRLDPTKIADVLLVVIYAIQ